MKYVKYLLLTSLIFLAGCSVSPNGDEEAVLLMQPWVFGHGGVDQDAVKPGLVWVAPTTSAIFFKVTPLTITEPFDDMITDDNIPVDFNAYLKLQIIKGQTPKLYEKFGQNWYAMSIQETFRTMIRDKASSYKMFDLAGNRQVLAEIQSETFTLITDYCKKIDIPVEILQVVVGAVTPPQEVLEETKRTAAQNQSILTQEARSKAEVSRKEAEVNKAIADKAYQNQMSMSIQEYLQLRALEIEKEKIELVREKQNVSIILGQGITPMYGVGK
ncbi:MAG TPA: SPFH domain-containing protein [Clostridiales bacterium]|nr:SPFH domain-containing protein [Clostridiales bacterium]HQP69315.1 SPFH domain-containing protein [Clostridiales bacterium]